MPSTVEKFGKKEENNEGISWYYDIQTYFYNSQ
jgi:hypothetical protein